MTDVKITRQANHVVAVEASGHTGYGEQGEDIVCAALSSVMQTAALGLLTVARIKISFERKDEDGYLKFALPEDLSPDKRHDAAMILDTMLCGICDLREGFSDFINLEVIER